MSTRLPAGSAAAARRVTGSCGDFTPDGVQFRVVCRSNLEIGLESDTQVGLLAISPFSATFTHLIPCDDETNIFSEANHGGIHYRIEFSTTLSLCNFAVSAALKVQ